MRLGDKVKLSEDGKKIREGYMAWWRGEVVKIGDDWITVAWHDKAETVRIWTERPESLEVIDACIWRTA